MANRPVTRNGAAARYHSRMRMTLGDAFNRRKKLDADLTSWTNRLKAAGHTKRTYRCKTIEGTSAFVPEPGSEKVTTRSEL